MREGDDKEAIDRLFAPEFRNRLDAVVPFSRLPEDVIARVVDKFILQLEAQLSDRNVTIELTDEARGWLIKNGYDEAMGARPMARVIQTQIKTPLADEVLFGRLKGGGVVKVVVTSDETGVKKLGFGDRTFEPGENASRHQPGGTGISLAEALIGHFMQPREAQTAPGQVPVQRAQAKGQGLATGLGGAQPFQGGDLRPQITKLLFFQYHDPVSTPR